MSLYNANGQINTTSVTGSTYTGLQAADGSFNIVLNSGLVGLYHPCGAYNAQVNNIQGGGTYLASNGNINVTPGTSPSGFVLSFPVGMGSIQNQVRNYTITGSSPGSPGTLPTNWAAGSVAGITQTLSAVTTVSGMTVLPINLAGTATATGTYNFIVEQLAVSSLGQIWEGSAFIQVTAGSAPRGFQLELDELTSGGGFLSGTQQVVTPNASLLRYTVSRTNNQATVGKERLLVGVKVSNGDVLNVTFNLGYPQLLINYA